MRRAVIACPLVVAALAAPSGGAAVAPPFAPVLVAHAGDGGLGWSTVPWIAR